MTKTIRIRPVVMSGGAGTRLWPLSREGRPKQFLALGGARSLFQEALLRVAGPPFLPPAAIGASRHAALIAEQAADAGAALAAVIAEPAPRNTAAVAAIAALWSARDEPGALVLLMPADQRIRDAEGFRAAVLRAAPAAAAGRIVVFGIKPHAPETGFGYVEQGETIADGVSAVACFREKPDLAAAKAYVDGGRHFWNAGIFLFSPQAMREELSAHAPEILKRAGAALDAATTRAGVLHLDPEEFAACPSDSVDYAVMEKTARAALAGPLDIGWSDVGSWSAVESGAGEAVLVDSEGALVISDGPLVAAAGVPGVVVVATKDAILIVPKERAQDVRKIVEELKRRGRTDLL